MVKKYDIIGFEKAEKKITKPITKFGGQPIGLKNSQWPMSSGWEDRKMMFVGQILIEKDMMENSKDFIAYIFVTHPENYDDDFFDPDVTEWDGGENAVIIQPLEDALSENEEDIDGPTVFNCDDEKCEYIPILKEGSDPDFITSDEYRRLDDIQQKKYNLIDTNKIGGTPYFFRGDTWPEGEWKLFLQLHCNFLPFVLNLGAMPILYVFISDTYEKAGLLVQG